MMETLWDAIARLFGGGSSTAVLPGDMPGDPNYHRPPGYDPAAARWAQISRALLQAGARVASAPRGEAVGQGLQGFVEGSDAGRQAYEEELLNEIRWREMEAEQQARDDAGAAYADASPMGTRSSPRIPSPANNSSGEMTSPYLTSGGRTRPGGSSAGATPTLPLTPDPSTPDPAAGIPGSIERVAMIRRKDGDGSQVNDRRSPGMGVALTEDEIDRMPLVQLALIDPAQLTPEQYWAVSRRLFREGH